jgi:hypothetical protein
MPEAALVGPPPVAVCSADGLEVVVGDVATNLATEVGALQVGVAEVEAPWSQPDWVRAATRTVARIARGTQLRQVAGAVEEDAQALEVRARRTGRLLIGGAQHELVSLQPGEGGRAAAE